MDAEGIFSSHLPRGPHFFWAEEAEFPRHLMRVLAAEWGLVEDQGPSHADLPLLVPAGILGAGGEARNRRSVFTVCQVPGSVLSAMHARPQWLQLLGGGF